MRRPANASLLLPLMVAVHSLSKLSGISLVGDVAVALMAASGVGLAGLFQNHCHISYTCHVSLGRL